MPRPRQRRGADARKQAKQAQREAAEKHARELERSRKQSLRHKPQLQVDALPVLDSQPDSVEQQDKAEDRPPLDPDTKAYFVQVAARIDELESLDAREPRDGDGDDDDRRLFLNSSLEELSGHELALAFDQETSVILERLLFSMDDFAKRVLADRFTGSFLALATDRFGSHVLQTLFALAGPTIDRESRGFVARQAQDLPSMSDIVSTALAELCAQPDSLDLARLATDPYATHVLRALLNVLAARPADPAADRSKRSRKWRARQGKMQDFVSSSPDHEDAGKGKARALEVPATFAALFQDAQDLLWTALCAQGVGDCGGVREAGLHEAASAVVRLLVDVELATAVGRWTGALLCGLALDNHELEAAVPRKDKEFTTDYLVALAHSRPGSPTLELIFRLLPKTAFDAVWHAFLDKHIARLAGHGSGNFVAAAAVSRCDAAQLDATLKAVSSVEPERRGEWVDLGRVGVLSALLTRAASLRAHEAQAAQLVLETYGFKHDDSDDKGAVADSVILPVMSLHRLEHFRKMSPETPPPATVPGSLLLQAFLGLASPHNRRVVTDILALDLARLSAITRDSVASRVLDSFLDSATVPARDKRAFFTKLTGHFHELADDRVGSRFVEHCWQVADVYLKEKIASSLLPHQGALQASAYGHFFARKVQLPLFERRRAEWKQRMAAPSSATESNSTPVAANDKKRKRQGEPDEIDRLFGTLQKQPRH